VVLFGFSLSQVISTETRKTRKFSEISSFLGLAPRPRELFFGRIEVGPDRLITRHRLFTGADFGGPFASQTSAPGSIQSPRGSTGDSGNLVCRVDSTTPLVCWSIGQKTRSDPKIAVA